MAHLRVLLLTTTLLLLFCSSLVFAEQCVANKHLKGHYFPCRDDGLRDMVWYWDDKDCDATGLPTPPRKVDLPCDITCSAGQYLPYGELECASCAPGTFSMGGGARFQHFNTWPGEKNVILRSWCGHPAGWIAGEHADEPECTGWRLSGSYMDSGNLTDITKVYSVLIASFVIANNAGGGHVKFRYVSDSLTHSDGLYVQEDSRTPIHLANTADYKDVTLYFSPGLHFVSWVYYKEKQDETHDQIAKLDLIEIYGLRTADDECSECTPGYYTNYDEEDECLVCPFNTHASGFAATGCDECPSTHYALQGQAECTLRDDPCDADDFEVLFSECRETSPGVFTRSKVAHWVEPMFCLQDGTTTLPAPEDGFSCGQCSVGHYTADQSLNCVPCPEGHKSDGQHACEPCPIGTAALPQQIFNTWDEWNAHYFYTDCEGDDCTNHGWELASTHIHSGRYPGKRVDVWMGLVIDIGEFGGSVTFTYSLVHASRVAYLQFLIDGYYGGLYRQDMTNAQLTFPLAPGERALVWNFHRADVADEQPEAKAIISSIVINGVVDGGAGECVPCPPGFYQPAAQKNTCLACGVGHYSDGQANTACQACDEHSFAAKPGSSGCRACGRGTSPNNDKSDCVTTCKFVAENNDVYDLSPLNSGLRYVNSNRNGSYFMLNFCDRMAPEHCDGKNPYICESRTISNNLKERFEFLIDSGNFISYHDAAANANHQFELHYDEGSYEECGVSGSRRTVVRFACKLNSTDVIEHLPESNGCNNYFLVTTPFACRLCKDSDFVSTSSGCTDGKKTIKFARKESSICYGAAPATLTETCGDVELDLGVVIIVSLGVLAIVLVLVAVIAIIFRKKQQLEHKYSQLKATNTDSGVHVEMQNVDTSVAEA